MIAGIRRDPLLDAEYGQDAVRQRLLDRPHQAGAESPGRQWLARFGHQQTQADIDLLIRNHPACGIGITTAWTPAIDIDVRDPAVAAEVERLAIEMLGMAPVRYRHAAEAAAAVPDRSHRSGRSSAPEFVMPGEDPDRSRLQKPSGRGAG